MIKTVFTKNLVKNCGAPFGLSKVLLTIKQLSLDTVHEMNLLKNELVLHLSLTKNVNLRLNLAFLAKD